MTQTNEEGYDLDFPDSEVFVVIKTSNGFNTVNTEYGLVVSTLHPKELRRFAADFIGGLESKEKDRINEIEQEQEETHP